MAATLPMRSTRRSASIGPSVTCVRIAASTSGRLATYKNGGLLAVLMVGLLNGQGRERAILR